MLKSMDEYLSRPWCDIPSSMAVYDEVVEKNGQEIADGRDDA